MRLSLPILLAATLAAADPAAAETYTWVDREGITHLTDDPDKVAQSSATEGRRALRGLWDDPRGSEGFVYAKPQSQAEARRQRVVRGAVEDLGRGETARASAALMSTLRDDPNNPEAHWYLAILDRQRGRYESARVHLESFLASAGADLEPWRDSASRRLRELEDERRLSENASANSVDAWGGLSDAHFQVYYDPNLAKASPDYAQRVIRYLREAREVVGDRLGAVPAEAMGVVFYGKATYVEAYRHRFSFQTVGFFDGRIHVVSAGHPAGELRALLFHEYAHAVFREQTGGDRPYWLNEGLAEISERASLNRRGLTRSERRALSRRIDAGEWLPLRRLAPSFSGLGDEDARAAYLQSMAAAAWIESRTDRAGRARMLQQIGEGATDDRAFKSVLGMSTAEIDAALQRVIREEFPTLQGGIATVPSDGPADLFEP
ncbi:MAG: DUF4124 domain-containing protein [Deltaproteobacteria bacterium]|nr:DUF4124 domain-containing protein [Deltaproteobacteria bacterium]